MRKTILLVSLQEDLTILGLKRLHYTLLQNGYDSRFLVLPEFNPKQHQALENLRKFVSALEPLFVGISLMSGEYERASYLCADWRKHFPGIPIIWGGIHPTVAPETCFPFCDYVCLGEGDRTIVDFAYALSQGAEPKRINNLCYPVAGGLKKNSLYPLIQDLDSLPFGDHIPKNAYVQDRDGEIKIMDRKMVQKYGRYQDRFYDIITSLGCSLSCSYCSSPFLARLYGESRVRKRSLESIIQELEKAVQEYPFIEMVNFHDDNFLVYPLEFLKRFKEEYQKRVRRPFIIACTPMWVTREKIALLREAGLSWVRIGLQSGSDRVLREVYQRKSLTRHYLQAIEILHQFKIATYNDVILDNPLETISEQLEMVKLLSSLPRPYYLQMFSLTTFPGTKIREMIEKQAPEWLSDLSRDYLRYHRKPINELVKLSPYFPRIWLKRLVRKVELSAQNRSFRFELWLAQFLGLLIFEPVNYFRLLLRSQQGSVKKALQIMPILRKIWFQRYSKHFRKI